MATTGLPDTGSAPTGAAPAGAIPGGADPTTTAGAARGCHPDLGGRPELPARPLHLARSATPGLVLRADQRRRPGRHPAGLAGAGAGVGCDRPAVVDPGPHTRPDSDRRGRQRHQGADAHGAALPRRPLVPDQPRVPGADGSARPARRGRRRLGGDHRRAAADGSARDPPLRRPAACGASRDATLASTGSPGRGPHLPRAASDRARIQPSGQPVAGAVRPDRRQVADVVTDPELPGQRLCRRHPVQHAGRRDARAARLLEGAHASGGGSLRRQGPSPRRAPHARNARRRQRGADSLGELQRPDPAARSDVRH